jgi:hypothetical protein
MINKEQGIIDNFYNVVGYVNDSYEDIKHYNSVTNITFEIGEFYSSLLLTEFALYKVLKFSLGAAPAAIIMNNPNPSNAGAIKLAFGTIAGIHVVKDYILNGSAATSLASMVCSFGKHVKNTPLAFIGLASGLGYDVLYSHANYYRDHVDSSKLNDKFVESSGNTTVLGGVNSDHSHDTSL